MRKGIITVVAGSAMLMLAACGASREERVATGALAGAGVGAVSGGSLGSTAVGAALGAGAGYAVDKVKKD
ncbi:MAG TPA: hypothetical protein VED40_08010 [Azospirillaceae bacterium]|nr:hypothetical protein [Azospirillaceae bacterium]